VDHRRSLGSASLWTIAGTFVPGVGLWRGGHRVVGGVLAGAWLLTLGALAGMAAWRRTELLAAAADPGILNATAAVLVGIALLWVTTLVATHLVLRPVPASVGQRLAGGVLVGALSLVLCVPLGLAANLAVTTAEGLDVLEQSSATVPKVDVQDPWSEMPRVNILLLGGDSGTGRDIRLGVRPDSVMLLSVDTHTGAASIINLPRQTAKMPFPKSSPLYRYYPKGFYDGVSGLNQEYALNAMYKNIPARVPAGILGRTSNLGADVMKISVGEALGLRVDYYVLVNMDGFKDIINAIGGIRLNVNDRVPIGGRNASGGKPAIPPTGWIEIGQNKLLDGRKALWFARGRYQTVDYMRMSRQRCVIQALAKQADPPTVLANYQALVSAGARTISTDVPRKLLPALAELALKMRGRPMHSLLLEQKVGFRSWDPNWPAVRKLVRNTLAEADATPGASSTPANPSPNVSTGARPARTSSANLDDECAYHPSR
jgi:LCP family protein required for cell wall assembly